MASGRPINVVVTCEHADNRVPPPLRPLFRGHAAVLRSHRGYDIGAMGIAERLADRLHAPLLVGATSRLVIELNRSLRHPRLFSEFTRSMPASDRARAIDTYYLPYRTAVEAAMRNASTNRSLALHVSVHTFTPVLDGKRRELEVGLLFDPSRPTESKICAEWRRALIRALPTARVRFNQPYKGTSDGFTTHLRTRLPDAAYAGIEVEVRNDLARTARAQRAWADALAESIPVSSVVEQASP